MKQALRVRSRFFASGEVECVEIGHVQLSQSVLYKHNASYRQTKYVRAVIRTASVRLCIGKIDYVPSLFGASRQFDLTASSR